MYSRKHSFYKYYRDSRKFFSLSLKPNYSFLREFSKDLYKLKELKTMKQKKPKKHMHILYLQNYLISFSRNLLWWIQWFMRQRKK